MPGPADIDLDRRYSTGSLIIENAEQQQSRLRREEADARHARWQQTILFLALLAAAAVIFVICVDVVLYSGSPAEQKYAWAILSAIVSGAVGFRIGAKRG